MAHTPQLTRGELLRLLARRGFSIDIPRKIGALVLYPEGGTRVQVAEFDSRCDETESDTSLARRQEGEVVPI